MHNYLNDKDFLLELDKTHSKETFVRLTRFTFNEEPVEQIQGKVTQGTINIDGNSSVRRTCSLNLIDESNFRTYYQWALNTKFKVEVGLRNDIDPQYPEIVWFPQGTYIIHSFSETINTDSHTINIGGKDKMCLLNGEIGGALSAISTDFGTQDEILEDGTVVNTDIPIRDIVREAVHAYAQEPYENIIINGLDEAAIKLLRYTDKKNPLYFIINEDSHDVVQIVRDGSKELCGKAVQSYKMNPLFQLDHMDIQEYDIVEKDDIHYSVARCDNQTTVGYKQTDLTYAGELIEPTGSTITRMLDKIVKMLGNYEYFYDLDGRFVFQPKKTYLSTSFTPVQKNEGSMSVNDKADSTPISYNFNNTNLISSIQNSPNLTEFANDYSIWGVRETSTGSKIPVHIRYAIDKKPNYYKTFGGKLYVTEDYDFSDYKQQLREKYEKEVYEQLNKFVPSHGVVGNMTAPKKLENGAWGPGWWEIRDWYEYYKLLTGEEPRGTMKWYSYGARDDSYQTALLGSVPTAELVTQLRNAGYNTSSIQTSNNNRVWLITISESGIVSTAHGNGDPTMGSVRKYYYESYYVDEIPDELKDVRPTTTVTVNNKVVLNTYRTSSMPTKYFKYPYATCSDDHTYLSFLEGDIKRDHRQGVYFYNPDFASVTNTETYEELINKKIEKEFDEVMKNKVSVCDWREIIYQMALDYYQHNDEDEFHVMLAENNGVDEEGNTRYANGLTGYEPFYIDMEAFWRDIYCPVNDYYNAIVTNMTYNEHLTEKAAYSGLYAPNYYFIDDKGTPDRDGVYNPNRRYYITAYDYKTISLTSVTWKSGKYYTFNNGIYILDGAARYDKGKTYYERFVKYEQVTVLDKTWESGKYYLKDSRGNYLLDNNNAYSYANTYYEMENTYYYTRKFDEEDNNYHYTLAVGPYQTGKAYYILNNGEELYKDNGWNSEITKNPDLLNFWIDFLDTDSEMGKYNIHTIGDRPKTTNDDSIKAIYFRETPTLIFYDPKDEEELNYYLNNHQSGFTYMQYQNYMGSLFTMSGQGKCAKDVLENELYNYSYCAETVTLNAVPIYYLEPNTRIALSDDTSELSGEFIMTRISVPLSYNGTMSITATKVPDQIY